MTLKQDLRSVNKDIKALERKLGKLIREFDKGKKTKATKKATTKPTRLKTTKKAPVRKTPASKKPAKLTATDIVIKFIMGRKRGADVATLIKKTRFDEKKIRNILYRANKIGKIKRVSKGKYVGA